MQVSWFTIRSYKRNILSCMDRQYAHRCHRAAQCMLDAIDIKIDTAQSIFCKTGGMGHGLHKIPFLMYKDVFEGDTVNERIVYDIDPYILRDIVLVQANDTIFL